MRSRRPSRRPRVRSVGLPTFDRVTNAVFLAVLILGAAAFVSYGPEAACRRITDAIVAHASAMGQAGVSEWAGDAD